MLLQTLWEWYAAPEELETPDMANESIFDQLTRKSLCGKKFDLSARLAQAIRATARERRPFLFYRSQVERRLSFN